jgi:uncharacterized membrane protein YiaA
MLEAKMIPLSLRDLQLIMAAVAFVLGLVCVLIGVIILLGRGYSREVATLATQTARIAQKGVSHEMSGLVSSASELVDSINQLVRTASGVAVFFVIFGMAMLAASYWIVTQIEWATL